MAIGGSLARHGTSGSSVPDCGAHIDEEEESMAKVIGIEHLTLDGVVQGPARSDEDRRDGFDYGGWGASGSDPLMQKVSGERMGTSWSLLAGRVTYEHFAKVWPNAPQPNPFTDVLNRVEKFVVSNTLTAPLPWQNSRLLKGDGAAAVAELKETHDKTLVIFGSGVLVQSLMRRCLIDEFVLQIHPLVLGEGHRLFADVPRTSFRLIDSVTTGTGVVIATYRLV
jgi:dihydrofolate reductase